MHERKGHNEGHRTSWKLPSVYRKGDVGQAIHVVKNTYMDPVSFQTLPPHMILAETTYDNFDPPPIIRVQLVVPHRLMSHNTV